MPAAPLLPLLALAAAGGTSFQTRPKAAGARPHIVFVLSDDLGYGDYATAIEMKPDATRIPTPNVARMAKNGLKFSRGYSGQVCAPSRTMLMLGKHLGHTTIRGNDGAYTPLLASDTSVAKTLKMAGYHTGIVGKWGLGNFGTTGYPLAQGFDYYVGQDTQVGCHDWYPLTVCNNTVHQSPLNKKSDLAFMSCLGPDATCTWANDLDKTEGVAFIRRAAADPKKTPFFLYLSTTTPHAGNLGGTGPKPALFSAYNPVPYPYNTRFANESGELWTDKEKLFASAVWAQDVIVGAVLDELEALMIEKDTIVFFSGDNGPDIPGTLFDDAGVFRGKKRSLHEGGIRQTIVVQWVGTIAPNSVSDDMFIFYDLLPTAAELAGLDRTKWPDTDGLSAVPIFEASVADTTTNLRLSVKSPKRFLYYEFCHNGMVNGLLPQSYASGWGQAVRFDDNLTAGETQWKAIAVNSNYSNVLLYNLTDDQSESIPLAGTPIGPDDRSVQLDSPLRGSSVVDNALAYAIELFQSQHIENPYWKSSKNASDRCCASCFSPAGCAFPCKRFGPDPLPPGPSPPPGPPVSASELSGTWKGSNGRSYILAVQADNTIEIRNPSDPTSCWLVGNGTYSAEEETISIVATSTKCVRRATGVVRRSARSVVIDVDYPYTQKWMEITWQVVDNGWPKWTKPVGGLEIVMDQ